MKNNKGMTLIALVITIIVLLILAAVIIVMIPGDRTKVSEASQIAQTDVSTLVSQYYETEYENSTTTYSNARDYVDEKLTDTEYYTYDKTDHVITLIPNASITGEIGENGEITWSD